MYNPRSVMFQQRCTDLQILRGLHNMHTQRVLENIRNTAHKMTRGAFVQ